MDEKEKEGDERAPLLIKTDLAQFGFRDKFHNKSFLKNNLSYLFAKEQSYTDSLINDELLPEICDSTAAAGASNNNNNPQFDQETTFLSPGTTCSVNLSSPPIRRALQDDDIYISIDNVLEDRNNNLSNTSTCDNLKKTLASLFLAFKEVLRLKHNDQFWSILYFFLMFFMFIFSLRQFFISNKDEKIPDSISAALNLINSAIPLLIGLFLISSILGALWILLMGAFVKQLVWATVVFIPTSCAVISFWGLALVYIPSSTDKINGIDNIFYLYTAQSWFLWPIIVGAVSIGVSFSVIAYLYRNKITRTVKILELATNILRANPGVFKISFLILGAQGLLIILWIIAIKNNLSSGNNLTFLYILALFWSSGILSAIQRMAVSCLVHHWYFWIEHNGECQIVETTEINSNTLENELSENAWRLSLYRASTTLFGTACISGLITGIANIIYFTIKILEMIFSQLSPTSHGGRFRSIVSSFLTRFIKRVNHYALVYAAVTGDGYFTSAKQSTELLLRTISSTTLHDIFTRLVISLGGVFLTSVMSLGLISAARISKGNNDKNWYQAEQDVVVSVAIISSSIAWFCMRFWGQVLSNVIDVTFICFSIDIDNESCSLDLAHLVFGRYDRNI